MKRSEENWKDMVTKIVAVCVTYLDWLFYDITNKLLYLEVSMNSKVWYYC